ncbi:MAG: NAD-dependent epimerase/dehydratase family protein [Solirubrobacteraceae bacterium]
MRVVVVGASGNVGTSVLEALARDQDVEEIVGVARRIPAMSFPKTSWRRADITVTDLAPLLAGADAVVHLAWLIQPSRDERVTHRVNVEGTQRVFDAAARAEVPALVYASSIGAYSPGPSDRAVDESWPTTGVPTSFYSRHKAQTERLLDGFEQAHPDVRVVRLRPALIFKRSAASEIRRLFIGPFLPSPLVHPEWLRVLPIPRGLRTQAVHSLDVGEAYRLAVKSQARGAFNIAAEPVLDAPAVGRLLGVRVVPVSPRLLRRAAALTWRARLQPTSPGWLDMGMALPIMDVSRARSELGWQPRFSAEESVSELIAGLRESAGMHTPPLDPATSGRFRWHELRTGVGARSL